MFFNPNPFFVSNGFNTQSNKSSYFNENISIPVNIMPNFQAFKPQHYERNENCLSEYLNNLYLYERIWTPLSAQTTSTVTSKTEIVNYQNMNIQRPVAHSTPRAIRKTSKNEEKTMNLTKGKF